MKSKKGFLYMITVSLLVVIIIVVFLTTNRYSYQDQQELYQSRVLAMNNFIVDFNEDVHRATFIAAFRSLLALEDHIATTGVFFNDTETEFRETFYSGTVNGTDVEIMNGSSFEEYLIKVNNIADNLGIRANISVVSIDLEQNDPWLITVIVNAQVNVSDEQNIASWNYIQSYTTNLPIDNLRDPLYSTFTDNKVPNTIRRLDTSYLVNGTNTTILQDHITGSYYLASNYSPSFLMRFENKTNASDNGIESIVDIQTISDQDLPVYDDRVKVDYIYFNNLNANPVRCEIADIDPNDYFIIPENRADLYEVTGLNYSTTCV